MNIIKEGTEYEVSNFRDKDVKQKLNFVSKDIDGITTEELLKVLINRHKSLNNKSNFKGNLLIVKSLKYCLTILNKRIQDKKIRLSLDSK